MRWEKEDGDFGLKLILKKKTIACVSCSMIGNIIQIRYMYVIKKYRNLGIERYMLKKVIRYAKQTDAAEIIAYLGLEPFCIDGQMKFIKEKKLYESMGFVFSHMVQNVVPCMKKQLQGGM